MWQRRELENYLISPGAVAKVARIAVDDARSLLVDAIEDQKGDTLLSLQTTRLEESRRKGSSTAGHSEKTVLTAANREFDHRWASLESRIAMVDAKVVIRALNQRLQVRGARTLNVHSLAKEIPPSDVPAEVRSIVDVLEGLIGAP
jgi:hypothetical protein